MPTNNHYDVIIIGTGLEAARFCISWRRPANGFWFWSAAAM